VRTVKGSEHARGFGGMPPPPLKILIFLKAELKKKVELKKRAFFYSLFYKKWFESDTSNPFDKV
jgi:hypothetical protein